MEGSLAAKMAHNSLLNQAVLAGRYPFIMDLLTFSIPSFGAPYRLSKATVARPGGFVGGAGWRGWLAGLVAVKILTRGILRFGVLISAAEETHP